jgi:hypothetical protein
VPLTEPDVEGDRTLPIHTFPGKSEIYMDFAATAKQSQCSKALISIPITPNISEIQRHQMTKATVYLRPPQGLTAWIGDRHCALLSSLTELLTRPTGGKCIRSNITKMLQKRSWRKAAKTLKVTNHVHLVMVSEPMS